MELGIRRAFRGIRSTVIYHEGSLYMATNNRDGRGVPKDENDVIIKITPIR